MNRWSEWQEVLTEGSAELGVALNVEQIKQLLFFAEELTLWNKKFNLTTITEEKDIITKHLLDSLTVINLIPDKSRTVLDVGTGGGFPGIPLQIARPDLHVVLLDSVKKKTEFLLHIKHQAKLCFEVCNMRAEEGSKEVGMREQFDIVVSRAVASLPVLAELCLPYVQVGGRFLAMKGTKSDEELVSAENAISTLGGSLIDDVRIKIPFTCITRRLIAVEKISPTPHEYPRRVGVPAKRPL